MEIICPCGKSIEVKSPSRIGRTKYCCKVCFYKYHSRKCGLVYKITKPNPTWFKKGSKINLGRKHSAEIVKRQSELMKGKRNSPGTEFKKGQTPYSKLHPEAMPKGEGHHAWKGDKVGYVPLHMWVKREIGKPLFCEHCGKMGEIVNGRWNIDLANKSHKYKRDLKDWLGLCKKCHRKYDKKPSI